jgi:hypothetical protein
MTTCDNRGAGDSGTTTADSAAAIAVVAAVVAPTATPLALPLTATMATPRGPSSSTPGLAPFRCGLVLGGRVNVQQPLPSAKLVGALSYGLPP